MSVISFGFGSGKTWLNHCLNSMINPLRLICVPTSDFRFERVVYDRLYVSSKNTCTLQILPKWALAPSRKIVGPNAIRCGRNRMLWETLPTSSLLSQKQQPGDLNIRFSEKLYMLCFHALCGRAPNGPWGSTFEVRRQLQRRTENSNTGWVEWLEIMLCVC